jgi:hypothetical protein
MAAASENAKDTRCIALELCSTILTVAGVPTQIHARSFQISCGGLSTRTHWRVSVGWYLTVINKHPQGPSRADSDHSRTEARSLKRLHCLVDRDYKAWAKFARPAVINCVGRERGHLHVG